MLVPQSSNVIQKHLPFRRRIGIFGSTGSVGASALDLIEKNSERFEVFCLVAGKNKEKLLSQVKLFTPEYVGIQDNDDTLAFEENIKIISPKSELVVGTDAIAQLAAHSHCDIVLGSIVGIAGLHCVIAAAKAGKIIALANKESLVCGGSILKDLIQRHEAWIVPVDSEHSALFQALQGHHPEDVERLILTASGGPFLNTPAENFLNITPEQALKHPRWTMGPKVTIDSSTMFNKALELIEAHWLFEVPENQISVAVHPQSIVHSIVEYSDGCQIAQLSHPDMKGPISYALSYPDKRIAGSVKSLKLYEGGILEFFPLDNEKFPAVNLAREVLRSSSGAGVVFSAADEVGVEFFLQRKIKYSGIISMVSDALTRFASRKVECLEDILALDSEVKSFLVNS